MLLKHCGASKSKKGFLNPVGKSLRLLGLSNTSRCTVRIYAINHLMEQNSQTHIS